MSLNPSRLMSGYHRFSNRFNIDDIVCHGFSQYIIRQGFSLHCDELVSEFVVHFSFQGLHQLKTF